MIFINLVINDNIWSSARIQDQNQKVKKLFDWMLNESLVGLGMKYDLHDIVCQFSDRKKRKLEPTMKFFSAHTHTYTNTTQKNLMR